jgi:2,3-bisphosphoglycerate-dependent phosphoglycerate mutase
MYKIVLLRHGESQWNFENRFTGWTDVSLTKKGIAEAKFSGKILLDSGFTFDLAYTSVLKRANKTLELCLKQMCLKNLLINFDWRLNERHYGALQGLNKKDTAKKYGEKQTLIWRRSYDIAPPCLTIQDKRHPIFDEKYININPKELPSSECLKDTYERLIPLWDTEISKKIRLGKKVLIVAHGNSLRALIKYLDNISNSNILKLNIPTGIPLIYELDNNLKAIKHYYLGDKKLILEKINDVKSQSQTKN